MSLRFCGFRSVLGRAISISILLVFVCLMMSFSIFVQRQNVSAKTGTLVQATPTPPPTVIKVSVQACWNEVWNSACDTLRSGTNTGAQSAINVDGGARTASATATGNGESMQAQLSAKIDYPLIGGPATLREARSSFQVTVYVKDTPSDIYTVNASVSNRSTASNVRQATTGWGAAGCPCNSAGASASASNLDPAFAKTGTASSFNSNVTTISEYPGVNYRVAFSQGFNTSVSGSVSNWDDNAGLFAEALLSLNITARKEERALRSVEFVEMDSPLDDNPNVGGGLRMFPDKNTPTDTVNRKKVKVRAEGPPDKDVFFKAFDVDDPSSNTTPIDSNGSAGNDNRGMPQAGILSAISARSNSAGIAEVEFTVTMQPGDNFVVAASLNQASLNGFSIDMAGQTLPTDVKATSMLTVWRKVYIEVDSMGPVQGNYAKGAVHIAASTKCRDNTNNCTLILGLPLQDSIQQSDPWSDIARFQFDVDNGGSIGAIEIDGIGTYPAYVSKSNVGNGQFIPIIVEADLKNKDVKNKMFKLYDDDDFNGNDGVFKRGDEGENIPEPNTGLITVSLKPAYIAPVFLYDNPSVPFRLNSYESPTDLGYDYDIEGLRSQEYWTMYILGAYQPQRTVDDDLSNEKAAYGATDIGLRGSSVFFETVWHELGPSAGADAIVAAHELGHQFGIRDHNDGGLMADYGSLAQTTSFTDRSLNTIRNYMR